MKRKFTKAPVAASAEPTNNAMKSLAINRSLDEETRLQEIVVGGEVYSLHQTRDEILVTDTYDYSKIYAVYSKDFWNSLDGGI